MIAIYEGEGTIWDGPSYNRINVKEILEGKLQKVSLFIMPGERDRPYHTTLSGKPNSILRKFVEDGGTYTIRGK